MSTESGDRSVIALDVGGTRIKGGVLDAASRIRAERFVDTGRQDGPDAVTERILGVMAELAEASRQEDLEPAAAGVVLPAIVDEASGHVVFSANIGWRDFPLGEHLAKHAELPIAIGHDVRAGGLAEAVLGAGQGETDLLFVAIGTGIAGAMVLDGRAYSGGGYAGEFGHMQIDPAGASCGCGSRGCLETIASASAIARMYAARRVNDGPLSAADVAARAAAGEPLAAEIWARAIEALATALHAYATICAPRLIVVGGGLAECGEVLLAPLREALARRLTFQRRPEIVKAALGERAGLLGAGLLARRVAG
jgi:glucokinase